MEKVRLPSVEELEARSARGAQTRSRKKRQHRVRVGMLFSFLAAAGAGLWLGLESHRTEEEVARELERKSVPSSEVDLTKQADRIINEIWKTEALEKIPGHR